MLPSESQPTLSPAASFHAAPQPSTGVLIGPLGLRAGWGILLFLVIAGILGTVLFLGLAKGTGSLAGFQREVEQARQAALHAKEAHLPPVAQPIRLGFAYLTEVPQLAAVFLAALAVSYIERRRFSVYGTGFRHFRDLLPGACWGLAAMALLVGLLRGLHLVVFDERLLHGPAIARFGLTWLAFYLLVGVFEEFVFRGYIQFTLMRGLLRLAERLAPAHTRLLAFWLSALVWSVLFFVMHMRNSGENPAGLASVFLAGILFSYALWRTGSLWWGIGFHMTWDWSQSFLYGVPDSGTLSIGRLFATHAAGNPLLSGGVDGPEGSLLMIPVVLSMFAVLRLYKQAEQPPLEQDATSPYLHQAGRNSSHRIA